MAKKLENMTPDERYEHYSKMRVKEQRERKKIADQIPAELSVQVFLYLETLIDDKFFLLVGYLGHLVYR